jgi:hypothetical protein
MKGKGRRKGGGEVSVIKWMKRGRKIVGGDKNGLLYKRKHESEGSKNRNKKTVIK